MLYDPAVIPTAPATWADLMKPEYKGKVGMMDDPIGNMMLAAILTSNPAEATLLTPEQLKQAVDYLIELKKEQVRIVAVSWGEMGDALSRGDIVITFSGWETIKKFCADAGKTIEYTYPQEGTFAWLDSYCIAKDAPNREVDHALANQIIGVRRAGAYRRRADPGHRQPEGGIGAEAGARRRSTPTTTSRASGRRRSSTPSRRLEPHDQATSRNA